MNSLRITNDRVLVDQEENKVRLYGVRLMLKDGPKMLHVLATGEKEAIGMAECAAGVAIYDGDNEAYCLAHQSAQVEILPLTMEGWGKNQF